jgi:membrane fusion protein, macrolide-specific efflux system
MKNFKLVLISFIILLVLFVAYFFYNRLTNIEKIKPRVGDVVESLYGLGTVTADQTYRFKAGVASIIEKVFVKEGDLVSPHKPLVKFDNTIMRSQINGTVTSISVKEGELVAPQSMVVTVTNLEHLFLEVSLEQQSILRVKKDQPVYISFESLRNEKCEGLVTSVYPRENQFIVRIELKKWPAGVLPGMTADVAILVGKKSNALLIPINSIFAGQVTRIRDYKKENVAVKLGIIDGEWGEVISDNILETDELIIRK